MPFQTDFHLTVIAFLQLLEAAKYTFIFFHVKLILHLIGNC